MTARIPCGDVAKDVSKVNPMLLDVIFLVVVVCEVIVVVVMTAGWSGFFSVAMMERRLGSASKEM